MAQAFGKASTMVDSLTRSLVWRGVAALLIGLVAIVWPGVTLGAVVILFVVAVLADAALQATRAFSSDSAGPVVGHLLLAGLDVVAAIVAVAWPGITVEVLAIWIGIWAVVTGAGEFWMSFASDATAGERTLLALTGLLSIALGVVLFARPDVGAVSLAEVFGLFSLAYGISTLILAATASHDASLVENH
jgi:uncharacterized membrane protein HdeD (DUF308 family)